jgi:hypothetical protein
LSAQTLEHLGLEPMVSTKIASLALGVCTKTIVAWIEKGTLDGGKVGGRWSVLLSSLLSVQQRARSKVWAATGRGSGASKVMADKAMEDLEAIFSRRAT